MSYLKTTYFAEVIRQPISRVMPLHVQWRHLVNPGRAGFARCWSKDLFRR